MHVVIQHQIKNEREFWEIVEKSADVVPPAGLKVLAFYPSMDGKTAFCIYQADSLENLKSYVDGGLGETSVNTYYAVNSEVAMGLPA